MGGRGMAGTGKRAGQKKLWVLKNAPDYFGKHGFRSRRKKLKIINLGTLNEKIEKFVSEKKANKSGNGYEITLKNCKVLSSGKFNKKIAIKASSFSKKVEQKVTKAGGSIAKI
jgi:large subunit ribosomal protein L15